MVVNNNEVRASWILELYCTTGQLLKYIFSNIISPCNERQLYCCLPPLQLLFEYLVIGFIRKAGFSYKLMLIYAEVYINRKKIMFLIRLLYYFFCNYNQFCYSSLQFKVHKNIKCIPYNYRVALSLV